MPKKQQRVLNVTRHPEIDGILEERMPPGRPGQPGRSGDPWSASMTLLRLVVRYDRVCTIELPTLSSREWRLAEEALWRVPCETPPPLIGLLDRWLLEIHSPSPEVRALADKLGRLRYGAKVALLDHIERDMDLLIPVRPGRAPRSPLSVVRYPELLQIIRPRASGKRPLVSLVVRRILMRYAELCRRARPDSIGRSASRALHALVKQRPLPIEQLDSEAPWAQIGLGHLAFAERIAAIDQAECAAAKAWRGNP